MFVCPSGSLLHTAAPGHGMDNAMGTADFPPGFLPGVRNISLGHDLDFGFCSLLCLCEALWLLAEPIGVHPAVEGTCGGINLLRWI